MTIHENIAHELQRLIDAADADIITPASLAIAIQANYGTGLEPHIAYTSLEHLKHMARRALAGRYDAESDEAESLQGELFAGLQDRYPTPRVTGQEPVYKRREALTEDEVAWNVQALRKAANSRLLHADKIEAWQQNRTQAAA